MLKRPHSPGNVLDVSIDFFVTFNDVDIVLGTSTRVMAF